MPSRDRRRTRGESTASSEISVESKESSQVSSQQATNNGALRDEDNNCNICFDRIVEQDQAVLLNCTHRYHKSCIDRWFQVGRRTRCPVCRQQPEWIAFNFNGPSYDTAPLEPGEEDNVDVFEEEPEEVEELMPGIMTGTRRRWIETHILPGVRMRFTRGRRSWSLNSAWATLHNDRPGEISLVRLSEGGFFRPVVTLEQRAQPIILMGAHRTDFLDTNYIRVRGDHYSMMDACDRLLDAMETLRRHFQV